jgi:hypothetical protein
MQGLRTHEAKQQSARVRLVACIGRDGLTLSNYRQNGVPANPTLEHALDGMATEDYPFAFHEPLLSYQLAHRGTLRQAACHFHDLRN